MEDSFNCKRNSDNIKRVNCLSFAGLPHFETRRAVTNRFYHDLVKNQKAKFKTRSCVSEEASVTRESENSIHVLLSLLSVWFICRSLFTQLLQKPLIDVVAVHLQFFYRSKLFLTRRIHDGKSTIHIEWR